MVYTATTVGSSITSIHTRENTEYGFLNGGDVSRFFFRYIRVTQENRRPSRVSKELSEAVSGPRGVN